MTRAPVRGRKPKRPMNRVDSLRALDRSTNPVAGRRPAAPGLGGVAARPPFQPSRPFTPPGGVSARPPFQPSRPFTPPGGVRARPPEISHPFIPGAGLHPIVPANMAESGSSPGTPNLAAMVMRSFQPSVMEQTQLVTSGAGQQPNQAFNFGGSQALPPGVRGMQPQQGFAG